MKIGLQPEDVEGSLEAFVNLVHLIERWSSNVDDLAADNLDLSIIVLVVATQVSLRRSQDLGQRQVTEGSAELMMSMEPMVTVAWPSLVVLHRDACR